MSSNIKLKPSNVASVFETMVSINIDNAKKGRNRRGLFLWGPPGVGKSSIAKQVAEKLNYYVIDIRLTTMEPTDLRGIPVPHTDEKTGVVSVKWAIPSLLPQRSINADGSISRNADNLVDPLTGHKYDGAIILLDELPNATPSVQAGAYQIVLDGELGEWVAPDNCIIFAAGNRDVDKGATFKMPTPLMNRFVHVEMKEDFGDWNEYAISQNYHPLVVGFLNAFNGELFNFDPSSASRGFQTPRSWEAVSDIMYHSAGVERHILSAMVAGAVGEGVTAKFITHTELSEQLPMAKDVLDGKVKEFDRNTKTSLIYAMTTEMTYLIQSDYNAVKEHIANSEGKLNIESLGDKVIEDYHERMNNLISFMLEFFPAEMCVMGIRTILAIFKIRFNFKNIAIWPKFLEEYSDLIV